MESNYIKRKIICCNGCIVCTLAVMSDNCFVFSPIYVDRLPDHQNISNGYILKRSHLHFLVYCQLASVLIKAPCLKILQLSRLYFVLLLYRYMNWLL